MQRVLISSIFSLSGSLPSARAATIRARYSVYVSYLTPDGVWVSDHVSASYCRCSRQSVPTISLSTPSLFSVVGIIPDCLKVRSLLARRVSSSFAYEITLVCALFRALSHQCITPMKSWVAVLVMSFCLKRLSEQQEKPPILRLPVPLFTFSDPYFGLYATFLYIPSSNLPFSTPFPLFNHLQYVQESRQVLGEI